MATMGDAADQAPMAVAPASGAGDTEDETLALARQRARDIAELEKARKEVAAMKSRVAKPTKATISKRPAAQDAEDEEEEEEEEEDTEYFGEETDAQDEG